MTTILEQMGGFESSFIQIAYGLSRYTNIDVEMITMSDTVTKKLNSALSIYFRKNLTGTSDGRETRDAVVSLLKGVTYKKVNNFKELRTYLQGFDLIYSKNEIIEAFIFKFIVGYPKIPPIIFLCGTTLHYPQAKSISSKLHNYLYAGSVYRLLTSGVKGFHTKNLNDLAIVKRINKNKFFANIANPFDFEKQDTSTSQEDRQYKRVLNTVNVLWAARLTEQKGVSELIEIIEDINRTSSEKYTWWIAGDGELKSELSARLRRYENVQLIGHVPSEKMPQIYLIADVFITTSKWESFGNTIIEAQSYGTPTLSFDIVGPNQLIRSGVNGYLVNSNKEFKDVLLNFDSSHFDKALISKSVRNEYGIEHMSKKLEQLFYSFEKWNGSRV